MAIDLIKLGSKGQASIPSVILRRWGAATPSARRARTARSSCPPVAVGPIEIYSDERINEFERENETDPELEKRAEAFLARQR